MAEFDPDAFLKGTPAAAPAFDPDAFLKGGTAGGVPPNGPSAREKELRAEYLKSLMAPGEPGYSQRLKDSATLGLMRPISGVMQGVAGLFDSTSTFGERYRAGVGAEEDYARRAVENTPGAAGVATDIAGGLGAVGSGRAAAAATQVANAATTGRAIAPATAEAAGRAELGKVIAQGAGTGAVEGAARNSEDVGSAAQGAAIGGALGGAVSGAVGGAAKLVPGVRGAQKAAREANQGASPEELKAAAKPLFEKLDNSGIAYGQPQTATLKQGLDDLVANNKYNPHANPTLKGYVDQLGTIATQPQGARFTELNNIRSALAEQARGPDPSTRRAAGEIIGKIDDLVLNNKPAINPAGVDVPAVHEEAKKLWKTAALADDVGWRAGKAERKVASKAGVNPDEANRGAFRPVLEKAEKPGAYSPYTPDQREQLARIVEGDKIQNTYRNLGRVAGSPTLRIAAGLGASALGYHGGLGPVVGALSGGAAGGGAAKAMLDRAAAARGEKNIDALLRNITGSQPKDIPPEALRVLLAKQAAQRTGAAYAGGKLGEQ